MNLNLVKRFTLVAVLCAFLLMITSCGAISEKYAEKINNAHKNGKEYTYSEVLEKLGDGNYIDYTVTTSLTAASGVIWGVKGCGSWDDVQAKLDAGKTVKGIRITMVNGKATAAVYREMTADDKE